jgi:glyceraldehyde-3-phosphate dehydrogenase/erythrose-4-phosphate dehydrogenase
VVIHELQGKLHSFAIQAPVPTGSVVDQPSVPARTASGSTARAPRQNGLHGLMRCTGDEIVSSGIVSRRSARSSMKLVGAGRNMAGDRITTASEAAPAAWWTCSDRSFERRPPRALTGGAMRSR